MQIEKVDIKFGQYQKMEWKKSKKYKLCVAVCYEKVLQIKMCEKTVISKNYQNGILKPFLFKFQVKKRLKLK